MLHLSNFAYDEKASLQSSPEVHKSKSLIERFCNEGFVTADDCVSVRDDDSIDNWAVDNFQIGFVKGQARILTLLGFCLYLHTHSESVPPIIQSTASTIWCKRKISADGLLGELFEAMRTSHRGELRKAPTVIQWAVSLKKLQARSGKAPHDAIAV